MDDRTIRNHNYLHVFGQISNHDEVFIIGNEKALLNLRHLIDKALDGESGSALTFTGDGEGYEVNVIKEEADKIKQLELPYKCKCYKDNNNKITLFKYLEELK